MTIQTKSNLLLSATFAWALAISMPGRAMGADEPAAPAQSGEHKMMDGKPMAEKGMMKQCQAMMEQEKKMMADMNAQDSKLTAEVAKMNRAPDDKKLDLLAAAVTLMVEQRTAMNARTAKMKDEMMQHMQMGKESMAQCPLIKGMKGMDEKSPDAHKGHQASQQ